MLIGATSFIVLRDSQEQASRMALRQNLFPGTSPQANHIPAFLEQRMNDTHRLQLLRYRSSSRFQFLWHEQICVKIAFI